MCVLRNARFLDEAGQVAASDLSSALAGRPRRHRPAHPARISDHQPRWPLPAHQRPTRNWTPTTPDRGRTQDPAPILATGFVELRPRVPAGRVEPCAVLSVPLWAMLPADLATDGLGVVQFHTSGNASYLLSLSNKQVQGRTRGSGGAGDTPTGDRGLRRPDDHQHCVASTATDHDASKRGYTVP